MFRLLKKEVLLAYQKHFPYFRGNWKTFSSKDIRQLIDVIEQETNQRISEKWIYTYLKKEHPEKSPRKDMLDILSRFAGFSGWDEFSVKAREEKSEEKTSFKRKKWWFAVIVLLVIVAVEVFFYVNSDKPETKETIETKQPIEENLERQTPDSINENTIEKSIQSEKPNSVLKPNTEKGQTHSVQKKEDKFKPKTTTKTDKKSVLTENDYQLILTNFMTSDLRDWKTRKQQLDKMLSDNLEVVVVLKNGLGAEYFNKTDFSQKLIIPTETLKTMTITELKTNAENKIRFIRIIQE